MSEQFTGLFALRDARESDKNFILATFMRGVYYGDSKSDPNGPKFFSLIPKKIFMEKYKPYAEALIATRTVKIACLPDDPEIILGYSIASKDFQVLDWVFVKSAWRNKGVAKALVPNPPTSVSHITKVGFALLNKFKTEVVFNPFTVL